MLCIMLALLHIWIISRNNKSFFIFLGGILYLNLDVTIVITLNNLPRSLNAFQSSIFFLFCINKTLFPKECFYTNSRREKKVLIFLSTLSHLKYSFKNPIKFSNTLHCFFFLNFNERHQFPNMTL